MVKMSTSVIEAVLYVALNSVFGLITIVGNSLILMSVYKTSSLQTSSNYFICSLAASDIVVGLFINTNNAILESLYLWNTNHSLRKMEQFFYVQTIVASALNLCAVSIDRYIAICKPLRYLAIMTDQKCLRIIILIWSISIMFGIPAAFLDAESGIFTLWAVVLVGGYLVPLTVIIYCYVRIMKIAHYQQKRIATSFRMRQCFESSNYRDVTVQNTRSQRAATTFAIITLAFVITFTPDLVIAVLHAIKGEHKGKTQARRVNMWLNFLLYTSSAINPIIYGFRNKELRIAARKLVCKKCS